MCSGRAQARSQSRGSNIGDIRKWPRIRVRNGAASFSALTIAALTEGQLCEQEDQETDESGVNGGKGEKEGEDGHAASSTIANTSGRSSLGDIPVTLLMTGTLLGGIIRAPVSYLCHCTPLTPTREPASSILRDRSERHFLSFSMTRNYHNGNFSQRLILPIWPFLSATASRSLSR